jgi:hypothetical protein
VAGRPAYIEERTRASSVSFDPGQRVISGGAKLYFAMDRELLGDSHPLDEGTWLVDVVGDANPFGTGALTSCTVYAVCASATSRTLARSGASSSKNDARALLL